MRWIIIALSLIQGAWLLFDGSRALISGDYTTPSSGPHAGQLGPWAQVVSALGINPRSTGMKVIHVLLGAAWLVAAILAVLQTGGHRWLLLGCSLASLWYLPIGTVFSAVVLILLFATRS